MPIQTKVNGAIKTVSNCKVKVGGAWKQVTGAFTKVNGEWKQAWASYAVSLSTTSYLSKDFYYENLTARLNYRNIHIQALDSGGNVVAEYKGSQLDENSFTIELYDKSNVNVGYVTIMYYEYENMIRYIVSISKPSLVSKMTLTIGAIEIRP